MLIGTEDEQMDEAFMTSWDDSTILPTNDVHGPIQEGPDDAKEEFGPDELLLGPEFEAFYEILGRR